MYAEPQVDSAQNLICAVEWEVSAKNPDSNTNRAMRGQTFLGKPSAPYVAFDTLTEEQVIVWVKDTLGPSELAKVENEVFQGALRLRNVIRAPQCVAGTEYFILALGDTDWMAMGAEKNEANIRFTATGPGTGIGTAMPPSTLKDTPLPWPATPPVV